jgi:hypothetical protein
MFDYKALRIWILLIPGIVATAPALADSPRAGFKLSKEDAIISPDRAVRVEQYSRTLKDGGYLYQFWTFDGTRRHGFPLNPGEGDDVAGYAAGFRFSPDSRWLVRMQKLGAGYSTLFLYRRKGDQFLPATTKPLGDLAWDHFFASPEAKAMHRDPKDRDSLDHAQAILLKGMDDNYAWLGEHWPESRYVVISLSFDAQGEEKPLPWIEGWRCVYDLKTGTFSVPASFAENNARAVKSPGTRSE